LRDVGITQILSSPLLRALDTAAIIARLLGNAAVQVWPELREGFSDRHTGPSAGELAARYPGIVLPAGFAETGWAHGGDTYELMLARCRQALERLPAEFGPDERVLLVTHGGFGNHLLHILLQIPSTAPAWFEMDYCAISRVRLVPPEQRAGWPHYPPCHG
jgi:broad specificity phosphatase PhoE